MAGGFVRELVMEWRFWRGEGILPRFFFRLKRIVGIYLGFFIGVCATFLMHYCWREHALAGRLAEQVAEHAVPQFGFKPRAFWRQDAALIGDGYQVGDA